MKKYLAMLCATMLCVCCLALAACGGNASSSAAASGSASASASASASSASADASFVGSWKLAAIETDGITMAGDLSSVIGDGSGMALSIKDDGTGTLTFIGESASFSWEQKSADVVTIKVNSADASASSASASASSASAEASSASAEASSASAEATTTPQTLDLTMKNGAITMVMSDETFSGKAIFTADGTYADAKVIDASKATPITSEDALVGTWTLSGLNMLGVSMYGNAADLSAMAGNTDTTVTFEKGGKVNIMGSDTTFTVSADGASIDESGVSVPVKALDKDIVVDLTGVIGMELIMVFSK